MTPTLTKTGKVWGSSSCAYCRYYAVDCTIGINCDKGVVLEFVPDDINPPPDFCCNLWAKYTDTDTIETLREWGMLNNDDANAD